VYLGAPYAFYKIFLLIKKKIYLSRSFTTQQQQKSEKKRTDIVRKRADNRHTH
jgi:hypothetical protein